MSGPEDKAKEIERALADRKDADDAFNDKLDRALTAIETLTGSVGEITKRVDAMEGAADKSLDELARDEDQKMRERKDADGLPIVERERAAMRGEAEELAKAQLRADSVATLFGMQAPPPMQGEKARAYRIRLLRHQQRNSPEFKNVNLDTVTDAATFDAIESRIYADAKLASATPDVPAGMLHEVQTRDRAGRTISKFYGEPRAWMSHFMVEPQLVTAINKNG